MKRIIFNIVITMLATSALLLYGCQPSADETESIESLSSTAESESTISDTETDNAGEVIMGDEFFTDYTQKGISLLKGKKIESLYVIKSSEIKNDAEKVLLASMQGILSKSSGNKIYIDEGGPSKIWKDNIVSEYGIKVEREYTQVKDILNDFKDYFKGYILIDMKNNKNSINVASSINGVNFALIVDKSIENDVKAAGLEIIEDVSDKDEEWAYENLEGFSKDYAAELNYDIYYHLRDYISLSDAFTFYGNIDKTRNNFLSGMNKESTLFGYGSEEFDMINQASKLGITSIPSDLAPNLSVLSSIYPEGAILQKAHSEPIQAEDKHYVCFIISDGDNVAYDLWSMNNYFNSSERGNFSVGYGISPSLYDLAPSALKWYYDNATNTDSVKDQFVAGPSGTGYTFLSKMESDDLDKYLERMNKYLEKTDLGILQVLDQKALNKAEMWTKILSTPKVDAALYFGYGETTKGEISWYNDKPVIAQSNVLWEGLTNERQLISYLNRGKTDPTSSEGYSLILVHCWTKSLKDIQTVVDGLNENVKVVAPEEFVQLIKNNVKR